MKLKVELTQEGNVSVHVPIILRCHAGRKVIVVQDMAETEGQEPLVVAISRALRWQAAIDSGKFKNATELAKSLGVDKGVTARTLRLALLSPEIIRRIIAGNVPASLTVRKLREAFPIRWDEQQKHLLGEE